MTMTELQTAFGAPAGDGSYGVMFENERTRVSRMRPSGATADLILKEALGPGAVRRTRHELRILQRLATVPGVVRLATGWGDDLVLKDIGGETLAAAIRDRALNPGLSLEIAQQLAWIVASIHRAGVVHNDINPMNVILSGDTPRPVLIDFGLASTCGEERPGFVHQREIVGTLPYIAPEQTGRTGMSVDERADLYGLGATVYELVTGCPPFDPGDPLQMVHDTLTRIPPAPAELDPRVPRQFSEIIMRLLQKDPDRRYQSADGLAHDLQRVAELQAAGDGEPTPLGAMDFPVRLSAPARLVGRDVEIGALRAAFDRALLGSGHGVLLAGPSGVGKTAAVDELRSIVTAQGGWFVTGKFDRYRQDALSDAIFGILQALGRLLLASSEAELETARVRISTALGPNVALAAIVPELAALLGVSVETDPVRAAGGDASTVATRLRQTGLDLLRSVASTQLPVVVVIDDLQWAGATAIGFIDAVLTDDTLDGVLLVGAYRDDEVDSAHLLAPALARWQRLGTAPALVRVENLSPVDLRQMLGQMLRLPADDASALADAIGTRTAGNPFDTVELVNALRRDGVLATGADGWSWDAGAIRRFVGAGDVVELLVTRIEALPQASQELLEIMACLGGTLELDLLATAGGWSDDAVGEALLAPLEDGLLLIDRGDDGAVRFRHERVQEAAYGRLDPAYRRKLHLAIARRLAHARERGAVAAEQYLAALEVIVDPVERRLAAGLFVAAGATLRVVNQAAAEPFVIAAIRLLDTQATTADDPLRVAAECQHHAVLYGLGRLTDADRVYDWIERRIADPVDLVEPACIQVASLTIRRQPQAAVALGMAVLSRLGVALPEGDVTDEMQREYDLLADWPASLDLGDDLARPELSDRRILMTVKLIDRLLPASFFCDPSITAWLTLTSQRAWVKHGPCGPLVANLSCATLSTIKLRDDYRTGYAIAQHALAVGEARGYEPETSCSRHRFSLMASHWVAPLEDGIRQSQLARVGLLRGGDVQMACFTHYTSLPAMLECSPTIESCAADAESSLELAARTGNGHATACYLPYRQLVRALRGETTTVSGFNDDTFDEAEHLTGAGANPIVAAHFHIYRSLAATLFGDLPAMIEHTEKAIAQLPAIVGFYPVAVARLLRGLTLAEVVRTGTERDGHAEAPAELDHHCHWLEQRARDAPGNFEHLATLLRAEQAWSTGDPWVAAQTFDAARRQVASRQRPWHVALIAERAARFHLASGLERTGRDLLHEAKRHYDAWCATAKVSQLVDEYGFLRGAAVAPSSSYGSSQPNASSGGISGDAVDMTAILRASQALSSETSLAGLRTRIGELLSSMTGATKVVIGLRDEGARDWLLWDTRDAGDGVPIEQAAGLVPVSAFRYAQRAAAPLLVENACEDDRFARDPYLAALDACSLLVVPILSQGIVRAVLILENTGRKGAFAGDRLDVVTLVTGQLAVSLDNAQLYDSLARKVADRTAALEQANRALETLSHTDALTEIPNRRHFDVTLEAELQRAQRQRTPLSLAMIDIDHFKLYNDRCGHLAGDQCLHAVAAALREALRIAPDTVCRYGGEEFAAILPGIDATTSLAVGEQLRGAVAAMEVPHPGAPTGIVTLSIGVATLSGESTTAQELVMWADTALYDAKRNGRNQVCGSRP